MAVLPGQALDTDAQPPHLALANSLQVHLDGLRKFERAENMEVLETREMQFHGSFALFIKDRYYDPQDAATWVEQIVFANYEGRVYRLELTSRTDELGRFEPMFERVLSTFQFECDGR